MGSSEPLAPAEGGCAEVKPKTPWGLPKKSEKLRKVHAFGLKAVIFTIILVFGLDRR